MTVHTPLGPGGEFDRVRALAALWKDRARGLGDDCAFVEIGAERLAVSVDLSVEGVHFRRDLLSLGDVGYRALMAAASDLAAMGALGRAALLSGVLCRLRGYDKDNKPRWQPATLAEVGEDILKRHFDQVPPEGDLELV